MNAGHQAWSSTDAHALALSWSHTGHKHQAGPPTQCVFLQGSASSGSEQHSSASTHAQLQSHVSGLDVPSNQTPAADRPIPFKPGAGTPMPKHPPYSTVPGTQPQAEQPLQADAGHRGTSKPKPHAAGGASPPQRQPPAPISSGSSTSAVPRAGSSREPLPCQSHAEHQHALTLADTGSADRAQQVDSNPTPHQHRQPATASSSGLYHTAPPNNAPGAVLDQAPAAEPGCVSDSSSSMVVYGSVADPALLRPSAQAQVWVASRAGQGKAPAKPDPCQAAGMHLGQQTALQLSRPDDVGSLAAERVQAEATGVSGCPVMEQPSQALRHSCGEEAAQQQVHF